MNTDHKLDQILERLERLEKLIIAALPSGRRPKGLVGAIRREHTPDKILSARVDEVLRQFRAAINATYPKKQRQGFNSAIIGNAGKTTKYEIVPESVLRNRCSLRKLFAPVFEAGEEHASDNATLAFDEAIARGLLVRSTVSEVNVTDTPCFSKTVVLVTPEELKRQGLVVPVVAPVTPVAKPTLVWSNTETDNDELIDSEEFEEE